MLRWFVALCLVATSISRRHCGNVPLLDTAGMEVPWLEHCDLEVGEATTLMTEPHAVGGRLSPALFANDSTQEVSHDRSWPSHAKAGELLTAASSAKQVNSD